MEQTVCWLVVCALHVDPAVEAVEESTGGDDRNRDQAAGSGYDAAAARDSTRIVRRYPLIRQSDVAHELDSHRVRTVVVPRRRERVFASRPYRDHRCPDERSVPGSPHPHLNRSARSRPADPRHSDVKRSPRRCGADRRRIIVADVEPILNTVDSVRDVSDAASSTQIVERDRFHQDGYDAFEYKPNVNDWVAKLSP